MRALVPLCALALGCSLAAPAYAKDARAPRVKRVSAAFVGVGTGLTVASIVLLGLSGWLYYQAPSEPTLTLYGRDNRNSDTIRGAGFATLVAGGLCMLGTPFLAISIAEERAAANQNRTSAWLAPAGSGLALAGRF